MCQRCDAPIALMCTGLVLCVCCLCIGIFGMLKETQANERNKNVVSGQCSLLADTLEAVQESYCEQSDMRVKKPWDTDAEYKGEEQWSVTTSWWEVVPCKVSEIKLKPTTPGGIEELYSHAWVYFRQQVANCRVCDDPAIKPKGANDFAIPVDSTCVDVNSEPIKSCSQWLVEYLRDEEHAAGGFQCSYMSTDLNTGTPEGHNSAAATPLTDANVKGEMLSLSGIHLHAGNKDAVKENSVTYGLMQLTFFPLAFVFVISGFCVGSCLHVCRKSRQEVLKELDAGAE